MTRVVSTGYCGVAVLALLWVAAGCSQLDLRKGIPWADATEDAQQPVRVVAVWTDTVMSRAGALPTRGFGGRLMFFADKQDKPIKVQGTLVVYAFDESRGDNQKHVPDRRYVFRAEELDNHYSKSKLGHSYSVWLPWDTVGGPQREITLLVRFVGTSGGVLVGEPSTHLLPGPETPVSTRPPRAPAGGSAPAWSGPLPGQAPAVSQVPHPFSGAVQQASYLAPVSAPAVHGAYAATDPRAGAPSGSAMHSDGQRRMVTTTIPLPHAAWQTVPQVPQPAGTQPAGTQPTRTQPAGTQRTGTQPAGTQPAGTSSAAAAPNEPAAPTAPPGFYSDAPQPGTLVPPAGGVFRNGYAPPAMVPGAAPGAAGHVPPAYGPGTFAGATMPAGGAAGPYGPQAAMHYAPQGAMHAGAASPTTASGHPLGESLAPSARFEPTRLRAPSGAIVRPDRGRAPWQPPPARWPYAPGG